MKNKIFLLLLIIFTAGTANAQLCYDDLKVNKDLKVKYKWKENHNGLKELYIKFKTTSGVDMNLDLKLGFYLNGVQKEKIHLADCLKRFFWNDWFRPVHIVQLNSFSNEDIESDQFELKILELKTEEVENCIATDA